MALACALAPQARAEDSLLRSLAKSAGLATDPEPPPDFVLSTRPAVAPARLPVFGTPVEPPSKVKSKDDLKAMDSDLDNAGKKHDSIRAAFPPAAKAVAEAEAARKAKSRKKTPATAAKPAF
jgi:hypothetical protein